MTEAEQKALLEKMAKDAEIAEAEKPHSGKLVQTVRADETGRKIFEYRGDVGAFLDPFKSQRYLQIVIGKNVAWNEGCMKDFYKQYPNVGIPEHRDRRFRTNVTGNSGSS